MSAPIRILHFADLHIGVENYGRLDPKTGLNRRVMDFLDRLDAVISLAIERQADVVLFAGDAFHRRNPTPTHQREFARRIRRLSEAHIHTVLLTGNHDSPVMARRASSLEIFDALAVPYVTFVSRPRLLRLETPRGLLQVAAIPYPIWQRLFTRKQYRRMSQEELQQAMTGALVDAIADLAAQLDPDAPAVLLGHFSVDNAKLGSERELMVGRDVTVPISALTDAAWDYVALGHIHRHQNLNPSNTPPVVYAGSVERVDFGEAKQPKGCCWVEVEPGEAFWEFVTLPARAFVTVDVDVRQASDPLAEVRHAMKNRFVADAITRLHVRMTPEQEPLLRDADLAHLLTDAFHAQIVRDVERTARDRLAGLDPDLLTPTELLSRYLTSKGKDPSEVALYLEEAQAIFDEAA